MDILAYVVPAIVSLIIGFLTARYWYLPRINNLEESLGETEAQNEQLKWDLADRDLHELYERLISELSSENVVVEYSAEFGSDPIIKVYSNNPEQDSFVLSIMLIMELYPKQKFVLSRGKTGFKSLSAEHSFEQGSTVVQKCKEIVRSWYAPPEARKEDL